MVKCFLFSVGVSSTFSSDSTLIEDLLESVSSIIEEEDLLREKFSKSVEDLRDLSDKDENRGRGGRGGFSLAGSTVSIFSNVEFSTSGDLSSKFCLICGS